MYILAVVALAATLNGTPGQNVTTSFQEFTTLENCQYAQSMFIDLKNKNEVNVNAVCLPK